MKKLRIISLLLILFSITGGAAFFIFYQNHKTEPAQKVFQLRQKPSLQNTIVSNADLVFDTSGWISPSPEDLLLAEDIIDDSGRWGGNIYYAFSSTTLELDEPAVIAHPVSEFEPRYLEQAVFLPDEKNLYLVIGIRNLGKRTINALCTDNVFIVFVIEREGEAKNNLAEIIVEDNGKWLHYAIDISRFRNKDVTLRLESWGGGLCGYWNGEWGLIDYIDVLNHRPTEEM